MNTKVAFAVAAHPDDIELMMGGTFLMLGEAGWELHYLSIGNGSCGSATLEADEISQVRAGETREACRVAGAVYHPPLTPDIEILYELPLLRRLAAIVREVRPQILLLQSPQDYMEDHMQASRLMVTAAFCRGMRNFQTDPPAPPVEGDVALYHALPWGLKDQLRQPVAPHFCVDVSGVLEKKREMLACHRSQKEWLDVSQGLDSYLTTMEEMAVRVGKISTRFPYAEGWRRHLHLGFGPEEFDPLVEALRGYVVEMR